MSLINTRLTNFRADAPADKWETRAGSYGFLDLFQSQSLDPMGIITDDLRQKAIAAAGSVLQIPVIDYDASLAITNVTQPVTITGSPSTSQVYAVTFVDYYFGFLIHPAQHFNNEISMQREFNTKLNAYIVALMQALDVAGAAALEAAKTQVLADTLGGRYSLASNVIVAPLTEQDAVIGDINPMMRGNKFAGPFDVVANPSMESLVRNRLMEKGAFNTDNKEYQYSDKTWHFTTNLANASGHKATAFAVQKGSLGMLQQFAPDNVMRNRTSKHTWDTEILPIINLEIGTYGYEDAVDGSSLSGAATALLTATKVQAYGFHSRIAFIVPYNSAPSTNASAIAKIAVATT